MSNAVSDARSKSFFLRMTPEDVDNLNFIAEDEQRPYTQVAAMIIHSAIVGYSKLPRRTPILAYCRRLEAGFATEQKKAIEKGATGEH
jgi:hypothetical protein